MLIIKILIGLAGLGIVVFVHELGHFLAARLTGITVEAFSIGWGKPIWAKKIGGVEYRLGVFPVGGYCKMAGENEFEKAWENNQNHIPQVKGTFFGARPWQRIIVAAAGPLFNIIFAALVFAVIWGTGFEYETMDNRIVLASDINEGESFPADKAGLRTGDRIIAIDNKTVENYHDIQRIITVNAEKPMLFEVERGGRLLTINVEPELQKDSGAGRIGVYNYAEPIVGSVAQESPAAAAGLQAGDRITKINGKELPYSAAIWTIFKDGEDMPEKLPIEYQRNGAILSAELIIPQDETKSLGIHWQSVQYRTPDYSIFGAIKKGGEETWWMLVTTVRSFRLLFRGIDLTKSVSGPVRITWLAGEVATEGFGQGLGDGLRSLGNFLALISIALGVTNLLPLPVLDGGSIILFLVEMIKRSPLHPRVFAAFQTAGIVIIAGLMLFALAGDILFFVGS